METTVYVKRKHGSNPLQLGEIVLRVIVFSFFCHVELKSRSLFLLKMLQLHKDESVILSQRSNRDWTPEGVK